MPKRIWIYILLLSIAGLSSCAKRNTAYQEDERLTLERQLPIVGNPLDIQTDDNYIYVAQDQGGISKFSRSDYTHTWITKLNALDGSQTQMGKIKKLAIVPEFNRMFYVETNATDRIVIADTSDQDTLVYIFELIGGTVSIKDLDAVSIANPPDFFKMMVGYCSGAAFKYDRYDGEVLTLNAYSVDLPATASGYTMNSTHIFLTAEQRGLFIYDRSNQSYVGEIALPGWAQKVKVSGNLAFVVTRQGGFNIVNIANPASPTLLASYTTAGYASMLDVSGNLVAVSSDSGGLYLFDVSDPTSPTLVQRLTSCGYVNTAKFIDNKLYVASRDQGILIYAIN
ncbi:MAG: beta-propeller domain-containing protein [Candidatus Cloacimonetes bacterium]|nr:beta-propeller domain-containing protein [Candidatus Cloacimonadota bacterium]